VDPAESAEKGEQMKKRYILSFLIGFIVVLYILAVALYISATVYFFITALNNLFILLGIVQGIFILGVGIWLIREYKSFIKKYIILFIIFGLAVGFEHWLSIQYTKKGRQHDNKK